MYLKAPAKQRPLVPVTLSKYRLLVVDLVKLRMKCSGPKGRTNFRGVKSTGKNLKMT